MQRLVPRPHGDETTVQEMVALFDTLASLLDDLLNGKLDAGNLSTAAISLQTRAKSGTNYAGNIDAEYLAFTTPATPDTEFAISHHLKRVPEGYDVVRQNKAAALYDGTSAWTDTAVYLRCSVASTTFKIRLF